MRIISGAHKGRILQELPAGSAIRPTSDRTREALFNILKHRTTSDGNLLLQDARFADICCGSGAIGCEALSLGARHVTFVDHASEAIHFAKENATLCASLPYCDFLQTDCIQLPASDAPYDIIFADPPYDSALLSQLPDMLIAQGWLNANTLYISEQDKRSRAIQLASMNMIDERRYGKNMLRFYQMVV